MSKHGFRGLDGPHRHPTVPPASLRRTISTFVTESETLSSGTRGAP